MLPCGCVQVCGEGEASGWVLVFRKDFGKPSWASYLLFPFFFWAVRQLAWELHCKGRGGKNQHLWVLLKALWKCWQKPRVLQEDILRVPPDRLSRWTLSVIKARGLLVVAQRGSCKVEWRVRGCAWCITFTRSLLRHKGSLYRLLPKEKGLDILKWSWVTISKTNMGKNASIKSQPYTCFPCFFWPHLCNGETFLLYLNELDADGSYL